MAKRRPRLVPKIVFRVALGATAVPMLGGCRHEAPPGVAQMSYGPVAQRAYDPPPVEDASQPPPPALSVAAPAFANPPPVDASADAKADVVDGGKRDGAAARPVVTAPPPPPVKGVAYRAYDVEGVAYRGYDGPKAGPTGSVRTPPKKP